jgi:hypothetical protein
MINNTITIYEQCLNVFSKFRKWSVLSYNQYFFFSFLIIFASVFLKFPSLSYNSEAWAEVGTNYLQNALSKDFFTNLGSADAGYLPLLQRLISVMVVQVFGIVESFPIVVQLIGLLFIAFFAAFINLKYFRTIFPDDRVRFVLSITGGLVPDYELYTFINFPYFGFLLCLLILFIEKDKITKPFYLFILVLAVLIVCSKAVFIIFAPVYGLFFLYYIYKKNRKEFLFYGIILLGIVVQLTFIYFHKNESYAGGSTDGFSLAVIIDRTLFSFWEVLVTILLGFNYPSLIEIPGVNFIVLVFLLGFLGFLIQKLYAQRKILVILFFLSCIYLIISSVFLNILATSFFFSTQNYASDWYAYQRVPFHRWTYFALVGFLLGFCAIIVNLISYRKVSAIIVVLLSIQLSLLLFISAKDIFANQNSNWNVYSKLFKDPDYYIPINPSYPWAVIRNTEVIENANIYQPDLSGQKLRAILILNNPAYLSFTVTAYDSVNKKQVIAQKLDSGKGATAYFYFPEKIKPGNIKYLDSNGKELKIPKADVKFVVTIK